MIVRRWQANRSPSLQQLEDIQLNEGLQPKRESFTLNTTIDVHRHPFAEILTVAEGSLLVTISGNQLLLRPGDRIEIPANTKHSYQTTDPSGCTFFLSYRPV